MYGYQGNYSYGNQTQYQAPGATGGAGANSYQQHGASIYGNAYGYANPTAHQPVYNSAAANPYYAAYQAPPPPPATNPYAAHQQHHQHQHHQQYQHQKTAVAAHVAAAAAAQVAASSYSGYDAAVYAAANQYLSTKHHAGGQAKNWTMNNRSAGGGAGYGSAAYGSGGYRKKFTGGGGGGSGDSAQYYCETCKISCAGGSTYKEHLEGKMHKRKEAMQSGEKQAPIAKNRVSYRCDLCNVTCSGQDAYTSHVRGKQHQKAIAVCKKMGKPVPEDVPTIIGSTETGEVVETKAKSQWHQQQLPGTKKVIGINTVNFVAGSSLNTTGRIEEKKKEVAAAVGSAGLLSTNAAPKPAAIEVENETLKAMIAAEEELKPIGAEYIDTEIDAAGKLVQFVCKLCDCKFSDPNAKDVHLKGRRHRTSYKQKVDPTIIVDPSKANKRFQKKTAVKNDISGQKPLAMQRTQWFGPPPADARRFEVLDDRHFDAKHESLNPGNEEVQKLEKLLHSLEMTLKTVSEDFEKERTLSEEEKASEQLRILQGVMRVGIVSKNIYIKGDDTVEIVIMCTPVPNSELAEKVLNKFNELSTELVATQDALSPICFIVSWKPTEETEKQENKSIQCRCILTSAALREDSPDAAAVASKCPDVLTGQMALAYLRHSKWFGTKCFYLQSCQKVLRVLRDLKKRDTHWSLLGEHMMELITEKVLASCPTPLSPMDAFKRVMEAIAGGLLFSGVIHDPCEKVKKNIFDQLDKEFKHNLTQSAQVFVRQIAFNQVYKVLGIERLADIRPSLSTTNATTTNNNDRKRQLDEGEQEGAEENEQEVQIKKEKLDDGEEEAQEVPAEAESPEAQEEPTKQEAPAAE